MMVWVLPKMALQEMKWSPFFRRLRKEATTALIPDAVESIFCSFEGAHAVYELLYGGVAEAL